MVTYVQQVRIVLVRRASWATDYFNSYKRSSYDLQYTSTPLTHSPLKTTLLSTTYSSNAILGPFYPFARDCSFTCYKKSSPLGTKFPCRKMYTTQTLQQWQTGCLWHVSEQKVADGT
jgi:hypothetical protein